ncbi:MAG: hypothetical protein K2O29_07745 [Ruminococcus sp.]|nr:hypothetical protein [Ruminococcus sp.]
MNGAGTPENPYVIMNADELYSMSETGGDEVCFSLGADIDLSLTKYADKFEPIPIKCLKFSGNGYMIRNVNFNLPNGSANMFTIMNDTENSTVTVDNLVLENIRLIGSDVFLFASDDSKKYNLSLEYCSFTLNEIVYASEAKNTDGTRNCLIHDTNISVDTDYCTFSAQVDFTKTHALFSGDTIRHTQIRAELSTISFSVTDDAYNAILSGVTISDSYMLWSMKRRGSSTTVNLAMSSSDCNFSRFYTVCEPFSSISTIYWRGHIGTPCFYDSEVLKKHLPNAKFESGVSSTNANSKNILELTTAQCKDVNYLRSVGFDCLGAEE